MLGSSISLSGPNVVLNTIVAESLKQFADILEPADDFDQALESLIKETIKEHKRILFNGNGYDESWIEEAGKRGLLNLKSTPDALPYFLHKKNVDLFTSHKVFTKEEMESRYEILMENYCKVINIEALTMIEMVKKEILPAVSAFSKELSDALLAKKNIAEDISCQYEDSLIHKLSAMLSCACDKVSLLEKDTVDAKDMTDITEMGHYYREKVFADMAELRIVIDELETITAKTYWPYPSYGHLLFGIR